MSTSRKQLTTLNRAKRSVKNFFSNTISTPHHRIPKRKSIYSLFSKTPSIHVFGILGIVGPLHEYNAGWVASDFATWAFLISTMEGYSPEHTIWNTIHPISPLFPNNFVVFGDAGCDRLSLPLPFSSCTPTDPPMTADSHEFTAKCIIELSTMAKQVKAGDRLIVLLIGHGSPGDGVFRLHITTKPNDIIAEAYITKSTLEFILKDCRGEVLLICNSCYSGLLASHLWTLLCAADSNELADALSESGSGHFRGSSFTACALAQVAQEHGLQYPLPRAVPRSGPPGQEVPLPLSPPRHSFPTSVTLTTISRPSDISSLETFFQLMRETERFLTIGAENIFQVSGALSTVTWTSVLTFQFNAEILNRIQPVPESEDFQKRFNDRLQSSNLQGGGAGGSVLPTTMRRPISPLLVRLVKAIPSFEHGPPPRTQEGLFAEIYHQLARHVAHPELYASPLEVHKIGEDELIYRLLPMHVQAIAVQQIASELGWHYIVDAVVMPFLPFVWSMDKFQLEEMIEHGVLVKDVAEYLRVNHFHDMRPAVDRSSLQWLMEKWVAAGKPVISRAEWEIVLKKAGEITVKEAMK